MPTKIIQLFKTIPKHDAVRSRSERIILEHGASSVAKTRNRLAWALEMGTVYTYGAIKIYRETSKMIEESIWKILIDLLNKNPEWERANVERIDRTLKKIILRNGFEILTGEINKKSDPTNEKIKTSVMVGSIILDDMAKYLDQSVFDALNKNIGKISAFNEVDLHLFLVRKKLLKSRMPEYRNITFQKILYTENRTALERLPDNIQNEILEGFAMPAQMICTNNPTGLGYWYTNIYRKAKRGDPGYYEMHYSCEDNKKYLSDSQKEYFKNLELEGGQVWRVYGLGLPVLVADPLDLYSSEMQTACYDRGEKYRNSESQFYDADGKPKKNINVLGSLDPSEGGEDAAAICAPIFEDTTNGNIYVFGFEHTKKGAVDSDYFREVIPDLLKDLKIKPENFGVDKQGTRVSHFLIKDGLAITEFKQAKCGTIPLNKGYEFFDLRAEIFWHLRQLMLQGKLFFCFPPHREFDEQMLMIRRVRTEDGIIKLIKKDQIRKIFRTSTDYPDSLAYACAVNKIQPRIEFEVESYFADDY